MKLNPAELSERYALLCRSTRAGPMEDSQSLRLAPHLSALDKLIRHDLRALGRQGSPDDFADICFELEQELERFQEFCAFPALAQKFVVAFGGGFSAGKSSLINALLGKRLLVTEVDPTTSLPTYLLRGDEDAIHAQNLFSQHIRLSDEEFLSLTHDEFERFGSNVSRLLRSAIISRSDFPWQNLALIDTPGYTKPEDRRHSERTDEHIARTQLNSAQAIIWVIDARQGCITEDDIKFLATLRPEIPRLFVLSRADQKPAEDIAGIIAGIRATLERRNLQYLDVVAVSARRKEWSPAPILEQLGRWNGAGRELRFAHNFKHQFTRYTRHLEDESRQAQQHLNRLNRILALADEVAVQQDAKELKLWAEGRVQLSERLHGEVVSLRHRFFGELKTIGDHVEIMLPEPSELEQLDEEGFNLLHALHQEREAQGKAPPNEHATLCELAWRGDTPKIISFLKGETGLALEAHLAAGLDSHCREAYARLLVAVACHEQTVLTETQSALFLRILESLRLKDIRTRLMSQAREMKTEDLWECRRVVLEHELGSNLFFDSLMLCRSGGPLRANQIHLLAELGSVLDIETSFAAGAPILAGFVLGINGDSKYISREILKMCHWLPIIFEPVNKETFKSEKISGYLMLTKSLKVPGKKEKSIEDCLIWSPSGAHLQIRGVGCIKNVNIINVFVWADCDASLCIEKSLFYIDSGFVSSNGFMLINFDSYSGVRPDVTINQCVFNADEVSPIKIQGGYRYGRIEIEDSVFNYKENLGDTAVIVTGGLAGKCADFSLRGSNLRQGDYGFYIENGGM